MLVDLPANSGGHLLDILITKTRVAEFLAGAAAHWADRKHFFDPELARLDGRVAMQRDRFVAELGIEKMFAIGPMSCGASEEFGDAGYCHQDIEEMAAAIRGQIRKEVNLLIKGSRAAGMERLVALLTQSVNGGDVNAV